MIGEIFGHNQLRSYCLDVQPVTCWHPPVFLYQIGAYSINSSKIIGNFLQSWTSTGYFSNSTGSSVTKHRFSPIMGYRLFYPIRCTYYNIYLIFISLNNLCANYWEGATMLESIRVPNCQEITSTIGKSSANVPFCNQIQHDPIIHMHCIIAHPLWTTWDYVQSCLYWIDALYQICQKWTLLPQNT